MTHKTKGIIAISALIAAAGLGAWWWRSHSLGSTIRIGSILGLTGPNSAYGQKMLTGFQFALDEVNGQGGVSGKQIEIGRAHV